MKWLLSLFTGGFGGYAVIAVVVACFASASSIFIVKNIYDAKLAKSESAFASFRASVAERDISASDASLAKLQSFIKGMQDAEINFTAFQTQLNGQFAAIEKDMKNAPPIPSDCILDPVRLRAIHSATAAANGHSQAAGSAK